MKLYDKISHRSYDIDPYNVNIYATRQARFTVYLHGSRTETSRGLQEIAVTDNAIFRNQHRSAWEAKLAR